MNNGTCRVFCHEGTWLAILPFLSLEDVTLLSTTCRLMYRDWIESKRLHNQHVADMIDARFHWTIRRDRNPFKQMRRRMSLALKGTTWCTHVNGCGENDQGMRKLPKTLYPYGLCFHCFGKNKALFETELAVKKGWFTFPFLRTDIKEHVYAYCVEQMQGSSLSITDINHSLTEYYNRQSCSTSLYIACKSSFDYCMTSGEGYFRVTSEKLKELTRHECAKAKAKLLERPHSTIGFLENMITNRKRDLERYEQHIAATNDAIHELERDIKLHVQFVEEVEQINFIPP